MKLFASRKIRNVSVVLTILHFLALISTRGPWSSDPTTYGFWRAVFSAVTSTIVINVLFVVFGGRKGEK